MEHKKKVIVLAILGVSTIVVIFWNVWLAKGPAGPTLPPQSVTRDRLLRLTALVSSFVSNQQRMPESLGELNDPSVLNDGWKQAFTFTSKVVGKKMDCEIRSSGADTQSGNEDDQYSQISFGPDPYGGIMVTAGKLVPEEVN